MKLREKVWRALLVLVCCAVSAQAWADFTFYVSTTFNDGTAVDPDDCRVFNWSATNEDGIAKTFGDWTGTPITTLLNQTATDPGHPHPTTVVAKYGRTWWAIPITDYDCQENGEFWCVIDFDGNGTKQTQNIGGSADTYVILNAEDKQNSKYWSEPEFYVVGNTKVIKGGDANDDKMTFSDGKYIWHSQYVYLVAGNKLDYKVHNKADNKYIPAEGNNLESEAAPKNGLYVLEVTFDGNTGIASKLIPVESTDEPHHYIYVSTTYKGGNNPVNTNNTYFYNWDPETFGYWPGTTLASLNLTQVNRFGKQWYQIPIIPEMTTTDGIVHAILNIDGNKDTQTGNIDLNFDTYIELNENDYSWNNNNIFGEPKFYVMGDQADVFGVVNNGAHEMLPNANHTQHTWNFESIYMTGGSSFQAKVYREQANYTFNSNYKITKETTKTYYPSETTYATVTANNGNGSYIFTAQNTNALGALTDQNTTLTLNLDVDGGNTPGFYIINDANWTDLKVMEGDVEFIVLNPTEGTKDLDNATVKYTDRNKKYTIKLKNYDGSRLTLTGGAHSMDLNAFTNKRIYYTSLGELDTYSVNGQDLNNIQYTAETNPWAPNVYDNQNGNQWEDYSNLMKSSDNINYTWTSERTYTKNDAKPAFKVVRNGVAWIPAANVNTGNGFPQDAADNDTYILNVYYTVGDEAPTYEWVKKRPTVYVYDFVPPMVYVQANGTEPNGVEPGKSVIDLDFTVGGTKGTNATADGTSAGIEPLGWYKYELPNGTTNYSVKLTHNGDALSTPSETFTVTGGNDLYVYWQGQDDNTHNERDNGVFVKLNSKADANKLHRIVVHVLAENATLTYKVGDNQPKTLENPSSFYGKLYYWQAFTIFEDDDKNPVNDGKGGLKGMTITVDGVDYNAPTIYSDVYYKLSNQSGNRRIPLSELQEDLYDKPGRGPLGKTDNPNDGRGTVIHLLKNDLTPPTRLAKDGETVKYLTISNNWRDTSPHASSNVGSTWWGDDYDTHNGVAGGSPWMGESINPDDVKENYINSRFMVGNTRAANYYTIEAYDGSEWYTWYSDRSVAIPRFTYALPNTGKETGMYGSADDEKPLYLPTYPLTRDSLNVILDDHANDDNYQRAAFPFHDQENMKGEGANPSNEREGFSQETAMGQVGGEVWLMWNEDNSLVEVTRDYESRAYQKPLCAVEEPFGEDHPYYIYYTDINGWDDVYVQIWGRGENGTTVQQVLHWPGLKMQLCGYDEEGHPVYVVDLTAVIDEIVARYAPDVNYDNVEQFIGGLLFNDGVQDGNDTNKRQSSDMVFANGGSYDYLGLIERDGGTLDLRGVWYSRVTGTLFAKGNNDYNKKSVNTLNKNDFAHNIPVGGKVLLDSDHPYDQSNWYEIKLPEGKTKLNYKNTDGTTREVNIWELVNKNFVIVAKSVKSAGQTINPLVEATTLLKYSNTQEYELNPYIPASFNGVTYMKRTFDVEGYDGEDYFFVEPKPCEFAIVYYNVYSGFSDDITYPDYMEKDKFYAPKDAGFAGTIDVDWSYYDKDNTVIGKGYSTSYTEGEVSGTGYGERPTLVPFTGYERWLAVIKLVEKQPEQQDEQQQDYEEAPRRAPAGGGSVFKPEELDPADRSVYPQKYVVYPINLASEVVTAIDDVKTNEAVKRTLTRTRYFNIMGVEQSTPFDGVNIIVKEYSDGSRESSKAIIK